MSALQQKLEEQKKIIEFLASRYEKDTGRKLEMPTTLGQLLGDDSILGEDKKKVDPSQVQPFSFSEAVELMKLPKGEAPKKGEKRKKEISLQPHHMLEKIDISGFRLKRFSRSGLKELIEGLQLMPCIRSVCLRDNGIDDECEREVLDLFNIPKIKCIDLSKNNMQKLGMLIGKKLKDEVQHIQWLDVTQNQFYGDNNANSMIIQGLKKQTNLIYVGLSVQGNLAEQLVKLLGPKRPAFNLNMRNSALIKHSSDYLFKAISNQDYYLTSLSLKFCFLSFEQIVELANGIRFNKSLVKLDLSNNALKACMLKFLLDSLLDNVCLSELILSSNFLDDNFANDLALVLQHNPVLYKVDISKNPIGPIGAQSILNSLLIHNETLGSLGDMQDNVYMGVRIREELRQVLLLNNSSSDKKKNKVKEMQENAKKNFIVEREGDDPTQKSSIAKKKYDAPSSQQAQYPLLKPVTFTNPQEDDYLSLGVWSLK